jgi:hypothetical protein
MCNIFTHMTNDSKRYVVELTHEEIQIIKSSLLFYAYEFVSVDHDVDQSKKNKNLAIKFLDNYPEIRCNKVFVHKSSSGDLIEQLTEFEISSVDELVPLQELLRKCPELLDHNYTLPI